MKNSSFLVKGSIYDAPDSTWIYLGDNKYKDSTLIINQKFEFSGQVDEPTPKLISLKKTKSGHKRENKRIFLENQNISITAKYGNLKNAKISAGLTQKEYEISLKYTEKIRDRYDTLRKQYFGRKEKNKMSIKAFSDSTKKYFREKDSVSLLFIKKYPNSYVSAFNLKYIQIGIAKEETRKVYEILSEKIKNSKDGKLIEYYLSLPDAPDIGDKYVDFELPDTNNNLVKLSDHLGTYTLLEFWSSWCGPCRKDNPKLLKTYAKYNTKGFQILGISLDDTHQKWVDAIQQDSLPWLQVSDLVGWHSKAALMYNVEMIPYNFLIDNSGKIVATNLRRDKLDEKLEEIFD